MRKFIIAFFIFFTPAAAETFARIHTNSLESTRIVTNRYSTLSERSTIIAGSKVYSQADEVIWSIIRSIIISYNNNKLPNQLLQILNFQTWRGCSLIRAPLIQKVSIYRRTFITQRQFVTRHPVEGGPFEYSTRDSEFIFIEFIGVRRLINSDLRRRDCNSNPIRR